MPKKFIALTVAVIGIFAVVATANADHHWNGYHWPSSNLSPSVADRTKSRMFDVTSAVNEWANLGTPIQPVMTSNAKTADITVVEGYSTLWLGLAQIWIEPDGHIARGQVKLNSRLLRSYPPAAADHVLCQELGHVWGLDHNRPGDTSPDDATCMNDLANLWQTQYTTPNAHDAEELNAIYGHSDGAGVNPFASGESPQAGSGHWVTIHVFPAR